VTYYKKNIFTLLAVPFCLFLSEASSADTSFSKKYAPYIGYQHGFTSFNMTNGKNILKYTPRFYFGFSPYQTENYNIGFEIGYTLPASYENEYKQPFNSYYSSGYKTDHVSAKINNTDFYLTFYQPISKNSHWFLKPGVEYTQRSFDINDRYGQHYNKNVDSFYLGARAGIGYNFDNGIGMNIVTGSRFVDLNRNQDPKRFIFTVNAEYAFK
jgi:AAA15 family ATPase/GTPase